MKKLFVLVLICLPALCDYQGYILFQTVPSKVGSTRTSPYSLLISGTFPPFATVANGGKIVNTVSCGVNSIVCPADLVFTLDSGCTVPFSGWDVTAYSPTSGQLTVSVEIPTLSNTGPVKVYGCAGNTAVTTFQGGPRGSAYDNNYLFAYHMEETSGTALYDSTVNADDAIKKASGNPAPATVGQVGRGQQFVGTANSANNDYALFQSPTPLTNTYTIEYWTKASSFINEDSVFLETSAGTPSIFTGFYWFPAGSVVFLNTWNTAFGPGSPGRAPAGLFHNIVYVRNGDTVNVFLDGVEGTPQAGYGTQPERWKGLGWDGGANAASNSFNGILDEVFFSDIPRSADYVTARFNNLSSPSTFYTVSSFTVPTPTLPSTTHANSQANILVF